MSSFPDQSGEFNYLFGFRSNSGMNPWRFNFTHEETLNDNFSNPEQKQVLDYQSYNSQVSNSYLFLSNPESGLIEVYNNQSIEDLTLINEYKKENRITGNGISGLSGFGGCLRADEDVLIVGAQKSSIEGKEEAGAVLLFNQYSVGGEGVTGSNSWGQEYLIEGTEQSGLFGCSVSTLKDISEYVVGVGAKGQNSGSGCVYIYDQTLLNFVKKIDPEDSDVKNFGKSLLFSQPNSSYLMIGQDQLGSGIVKIYKESTSGQEDFNINGSIQPNQGHSGDMFGYSIDGDNNSFIVGAPNDNQSGAAYYYEYNYESGVFAIAQEIRPYDLGLADNFGKNIAVNNNLAVITSNKNSGKAYIYERNQGLWSIKSEISGSLTNSSGSFGGDMSGSFNTAFQGNSLILGSAENEINYFFTTGDPIHNSNTGFSMSGNAGKFYDNDGHFLYGYNQFEEILISGNVFSENHNIFINNNICNSNCSKNSGALNSWNMIGESGLSYYFMSIIDVES